MSGWAIDLGTTNSGVALWDEALGQPRLLELPEICRQPTGDDPLEAPKLIPSGVQIVEEPGLWDRLGSWSPLARRVFIGRQAWIGRPALERSRDEPRPSFVPSFKAALGREALRPLARVRKRHYTARQIATTFLRELLAEVKRSTGKRVRDMVLTVPVDSYEPYRAELLAIADRLGVRRLRFIDEPLAAVLGYGLGAESERRVLVLDFGGGTLHLALVELARPHTSSGHARVVAKAARPIGGRTVDEWILEEITEELGCAVDEDGDWEQRLWRRLMLAEACRVKEAVFFAKSALFRLTPPTSLRRTEARPSGTFAELTEAGLVDLLRRHGLYRTLHECLDAVAGEAAEQGVEIDEVEDVLMVGGSTLLPGIYPFFEERFGRERVRAWQPFEAVAFGAVAFAAERFSKSDFLVHDYAFVTYDPETNAPQHNVIVPRGTRFPTVPNFWKRQVVPTCPLGEPESMFKLVICEVGRAHDGDRRFTWDSAGTLRKLGGRGGDDGEVVIPLNEASPTLGYLDPPHRPGDRRPRLEVAFGVDGDRWLVATVHDLLADRELMKERPVVKLL
jgi:molecular chaperone DnaK (HSP70)